MSSVVLDASALLALLLNEPGADRVLAALDSAVISSVNMAEVVGHYARHGAAEDDIRLMLASLPLEVAPFDETMAHSAGMMRPVGERVGLSLGDRACLALAQQRGVRALTADRVWEKIARAVRVEVEIIR